jgi:hypothetical protein
VLESDRSGRRDKEDGKMRTPFQTRRRRSIAAALAAASLVWAPSAGARPESGEPGVTPPTAPAQVEVVTADGFDWADAGIGAGAAVGLVLLAAAATTAVGHGRRLASSQGGAR